MPKAAVSFLDPTTVLFTFVLCRNRVLITVFQFAALPEMNQTGNMQYKVPGKLSRKSQTAMSYTNNNTFFARTGGVVTVDSCD